MERAFLICCEATEDATLDRMLFGCTLGLVLWLMITEDCIGKWCGTGSDPPLVGVGWECEGGSVSCSVFDTDACGSRGFPLSRSAFGACMDRKLEPRGGKWLPWDARDLRLALLLDLDKSELRLAVCSIAS